MIGLRLTRRRPIQDLERLARSRFERDGGIALLAPPGDEWQELQLRRLSKRLRDDPRLQVGLFDGGGFRYLTVTGAGVLVAAFTGWPTDYNSPRSSRRASAAARSALVCSV